MSTILVGVDDSVRSKDAVAFARALARASGARVVVASAFAYDDTPSRAANLEYRAALKAQAQDTALDMARRLELVPEDRITIRTPATVSPAHALHDIAETDHAGLVVVGSSHTGRLGRVLPGSTAERLLHGAPCAVAVVPLGYRESDHELRRIGVAYDGSDEAAGALSAAVEVARAVGARLRVIHVHTEAYAAPARVPLPGSSHLDERKTMEQRARASLDRVVADLPQNLHPEAVLVTGAPIHELARASEELDLLVTGSRRYGPLRSTLLGGVTGPLLREAHCPVLVVPRGVEAPLGTLFAEHEEPVG
jgi:nucleotide-binding universal stress UspA family protein